MIDMSRIGDTMYRDGYRDGYEDGRGDGYNEGYALGLEDGRATMREIDLIPIRLHKGEPTWEIIDELLEMIDSSPSEEEIEARVKEAGYEAYDNGMDAGFDSGYDDGVGIGYSAGYYDGYDDGKVAAGD